MYGQMYGRDKITEPFMTTLENSFKLYVERYSEKPSFIECSIKDFQEDFIYEGVLVTPKRHIIKGGVWMAGNTIPKNKGDIFNG